MVDKVTQANRKIAQASSKMTAGPVGAKMMEMMDVPSFAKGLTPQMLIDLAKDKKIITKEQQADFKNRVGKDRTALAEFNEIVTKADQPNLAYKGQSPAQIEMLRAKGLMPATALNKTERVNLLKQSKKILDEAASMDASKETKVKTFLQNMKTVFGELADTPIVKKIANKALMILKFIPSGPLDALEFIPQDIFEQDFLNTDREPEFVAKGGIMNINDIIKPVGV